MGDKRIPVIFQDSAAEIPSASKFNNNFSHLNLVPWNLINNGGMEQWAGGPAVAPDDWTLFGNGASVARVTDRKQGDYAAALTYGSSDAYLKQSASELAGLKSHTVKAWAWVKCSTPNAARLRIRDGIGSSVSAFHSGSGLWEFLDLTHEVASSATELSIELHMEAGGTAYFDATVLVDYDDITGFYPSGKDLSGELSTSGLASLSADQIFTGANTFSGGVNLNGQENNVPAWEKFTKTYADFLSAGYSNTITLFTLPAGGVIHGVKIKHRDCFSGNSITGYTIAVGIDGALSKYASPFDVYQVYGDNVFEMALGFFSESHANATLVKVTATSINGTLNIGTQGVVDIWVLKSVAK